MRTPRIVCYRPWDCRPGAIFCSAINATRSLKSCGHNSNFVAAVGSASKGAEYAHTGRVGPAPSFSSRYAAVKPVWCTGCTMAQGRRRDTEEFTASPCVTTNTLPFASSAMSCPAQQTLYQDHPCQHAMKQQFSAWRQHMCLCSLTCKDRLM